MKYTLTQYIGHNVNDYLFRELNKFPHRFWESSTLGGYKIPKSL